MHVPQDLMWWRILKSFWFLGELNKALVSYNYTTKKNKVWTIFGATKFGSPSAFRPANDAPARVIRKVWCGINHAISFLRCGISFRAEMRGREGVFVSPVTLRALRRCRNPAHRHPLDPPWFGLLPAAEPDPPFTGDTESAVTTPQPSTPPSSGSGSGPPSAGGCPRAWHPLLRS